MHPNGITMLKTVTAPKPSKKAEYSIVVPVYNSEHTLAELCGRIEKALGGVTDAFEIILVDDCSQDSSWQRMKEVREKDDRIKIIHLIRNFGQANATLCGFNFCSGKYVITMDDDLQHPPEEIPKLIQKINEGYLIVFGKYKVKMHSRLENFFSRSFQAFERKILGLPGDIYLSSFAIYSSIVIKNAISLNTSYPFIEALTCKSAPAGKITNVEVLHQKRKVGRSNYNLPKLFKISLNLLINHSSLPLLLIGIAGTAISLLSFGYGSAVLILKLIDPGYGITGWNSLIVALCFLGGSILMALGIIGEYLHRILAELSYEKPFIIEEMES